MSAKRAARSLLWLVAVAGTLAGRPPGESRIGIYHWGPRPARPFAEAMNAISGLGGRLARIAVSPRALLDYGLSQTCWKGFTLTVAAQSTEMRAAFDHPDIDVLILTAYDGVSWSDCGRLSFLDPLFYTPERTQAMIREYSDFTLYLYRTYRNSAKRFILSNWESDHSIYCGNAFLYARDAAFRANCRARYRQLYGIEGPEQALEGLRLWFRTRAKGVSDGRTRAQEESIGGIRVFLAPEFNIVRALREAGLPSVLYDVLPFVPFDYVSYSAWESITTADPVKQLWADLDTVQQIVGSSAIIVGEAGFARNAPEASVARTDEVVAAALAWGAAYVVEWQLFDPDDHFQYGLFDGQGRATPLAEWFRDRLRKEKRESAIDRERLTPPSRLTPRRPDDP
ncbi:MAG: hypothetical protein SFV54_14810 [Bryobacteraceae bacterium]|nr:hypothetical protein [Bryobacteraceae bacterium]